MSERERILSRLSGTGPSNVPAPYKPNLREVDASWDHFATRLGVLGGKVVTWTDLARLPGRNWCVEYDVSRLPTECGSYSSVDPWAADVGVSLGSVAVAETGTVLINHGPTGRRLASLTPPHQVVVVKKDDLVATLEEAFMRLEPGNAVLITGPSRTADIEGVLVRGVHGPKEIWVVVDED